MCNISLLPTPILSAFCVQATEPQATAPSHSANIIIIIIIQGTSKSLKDGHICYPWKTGKQQKSLKDGKRLASHIIII